MKQMRNLAVAQASLSIFLCVALFFISLQLREAAAEIRRLREMQETVHFTHFPDTLGLDCWVASGSAQPGVYQMPTLTCDYRDK